MNQEPDSASAPATSVQRYYFNLRDGVEVPDDQGSECASLDEAIATAVKGARDIMAGEIREGRLPLDEEIRVTDAAGNLVHVQRFRDAITIGAAPSGEQ